MQSGPLFFSKDVLAFFFDVLNVLDPPVDKCFLWQQGVEDELSVLKIIAVQILGFNFLLGHNVLAVKNAKLWDVKEYLQAIVLLVLYWVEAQVQFG
jgi:hypothetical protein